MATKPTLQDTLTALKMFTGKMEPDLKYDVNGDGVVNLTDQMGLLKSYLGKDPGFAFVGDTFSSPSTKTAEEYAAENRANQERIAAEQKETERRQTLLADANKIAATSRNPVTVTAEDVANNPNLSAQQLVNKTTTDYWSKQNPIYGSVINAIDKGTAKFAQMQVGEDESGSPVTELVLTTDPKRPNWDNSLTLKPTGTPNVYSFSLYDRASRGNIHGLLAGNPETGQVAPIQNAAQQFFYTPGSGGGFFGNLASDFGSAIGSLGDIVKELGPVATVLGNAIAPGLGTALSVVTAIDEGANPADIAKTIAIGEAVNQLGISGDVSQATGSQAAGQVAAGTVQGLLSGQNLEDALLSGLKSVKPTNDFEAEVNQVLDLPATQDTLLSGQDLAVDTIAGNTVQDVITNLVNNADTVLSGQDLAADSIAGNTVQDVVTTLVNNIIGNADTLVSGQDLAADSITGNTLQDVVTTLVNNLTNDTIGTTSDTIGTTNDTLLSGQDLSADTINGSTLQDIVNVLNQDTVLSGQDLASDLATGTANTLDDITKALSGEGTLITGQDLASDLKTGTANTLNDISIALATEGTGLTGQDLAADNTAGNTLTDIANVLTTNNDTGGGATADDVIKTLSDIAKVASVVSVADSVINTGNQPTQRTGFDIVPVPTDWKSPVYDQSFTPIDINSILDNINRLQNTQWATPKTYGGAYMGTPVNISDIVNNIMGAELTPQSMPTNITNAVGGILGSSTTR